MRRVLATAGHVDHGKSTLVRALTGRDPDRLVQERKRGLTIELGYAWTTLPGGTEVAFVDVPGHQRFVGTMLSGLGPAPTVVFVVAADQGWQEQSREHLAAVQALGITDGLLVLTRCDLAEAGRRARVRSQASRRLAAAGLDVPAYEVSAVTGDGLDAVRSGLDALVTRMPPPDPDAPVRLWGDRSFTISGAGTVVTGTLGAGTLHSGDRLTLLDHGTTREVTVRGLHSQDSARDEVGPVSRVAVNLRRTDDVSRSVALLTPGAFPLARVVDVALVPVDGDEGGSPGDGGASPEVATLHVGSADVSVHVRPLGTGAARLTADADLPWRVGDRAILRDPGSRRLWSVRVLDVDPLPLHRRGAAAARGDALVTAASDHSLADVRVRTRSAEHSALLEQLGTGSPTDAVAVGRWWVDSTALSTWRERLVDHITEHHRRQPLSAGITVAEAARALRLPVHLRTRDHGGNLPHEIHPPAGDLVRHLVTIAGLSITDGRVHAPRAAGLGEAEAGIRAVEEKLRQTPFVTPERRELADLGLGTTQLAAAERLGRILRLPDDVVLLPDGPARAMRVLAGLEQPFTLSAARQALGTTRRVAVPLMEHLDSRGWTRRVDGSLREVVR
ncbi:SelB C-terminal domain-containing protein [Janibacter alittae]|uniref:SelB C-terminal domain-containing protein n=1 Tax=Janibacter alittae TaxID=3115209 RepID=A0ABZ2MGQ2_9MICO